MRRNLNAAGWLSRFALVALLGVASVPAIAQTPHPTVGEGHEEEGSVVENLVAPRVILNSQRAPDYPPAALAARFGAKVTVDVVVLPNGSVGEVVVLECTHPKVGFEDSTVAAVKQWRFEPATKDDQPVEHTLRWALNFRVAGVGVNAQPYVSAGSQGESLGAPGTALRDLNDPDRDSSDRKTDSRRGSFGGPEGGKRP